MYHYFDCKNQLFIKRYMPSHLHKILWSKMPSGGRFSSRPLSCLHQKFPTSSPETLVHLSCSPPLIHISIPFPPYYACSNHFLFTTPQCQHSPRCPHPIKLTCWCNSHVLLSTHVLEKLLIVAEGLD